MIEPILTNKYIKSKGLDLFSDHGGVTLQIQDNTDWKKGLRGRYLARNLYTCNQGVVGAEGIFFDVVAGGEKEKGRFPKRTYYSREFKNSAEGARFTPVGCNFDDVPTKTLIYIVGGIADAITVWNAIGTPLNGVVLAVVGESNAKILVSELRPHLAPGARIITALDNDIKSQTGQREAVRSRSEWVVPSSPGFDWNDVYVNQGIDEVTAQLSAVNDCVPDFDIWELPTFDFGESYGRKNRLGTFRKLTNSKDVAAAAKALTWQLRNEIGVRFENGDRFINFLIKENYRISEGTAEQLKRSAWDIETTARNRSLTHVKVSHDQLASHNHTPFPSSAEATSYALTCRGVTFIKAPHGDGKTSLIAKPYVKQSVSKKENVVALAHLRTLVADLATKFLSEHYESIQSEFKTEWSRRYLTIEEWIEAEGMRAIAICLPSIIGALKHAVAKVNTLIIDEVSQVVRFLTSKVGDIDNVAVFDQFVEIIKSAKNIVALDADLNTLTVSFFEKIRPNEVFNFITVKNPPSFKTGMKVEWLYGESHADYIINVAAAELDQGKRVCIATDSQRRAENAYFLLSKACPDKRILSIHGKNSSNKDQQEFIKNPDLMAENYDCIIHSPSIRSGVSISKVHFDTGFGLFCGATIAPQDAIQMLRRCRTIKQWYIGINERVENSLIDEVVVDSQQRYCDALLTQYGVTGITNNKEYNALHNSVKSMEDECKANFPVYLHQMLKHYGFHVTMQDADDLDDNEHEYSLSDISDQRREAFKSEICNAPTLSSDEYDELLNQEQKTDADHAAIIAHRIRYWFGVAIITDDLISLFENSAIKKIMNLKWAINGDRMDENHGKTAATRKYMSIKGEHIRRLVNLAGVEIDAIESISVHNSDVTAVSNYIWENRQTLIFLGLLAAKFYSYPKINKRGEITGFVEKKRPKKDGTLLRDCFDKCGLLVSINNTKKRIEGKLIRLTNYEPHKHMEQIMFGVNREVETANKEIDYLVTVSACLLHTNYLANKDPDYYDPNNYRVIPNDAFGDEFGF